VRDYLEGGEADLNSSVPAFEATLRFATSLVQDGVSGVTVIVPRVPGVLARARTGARQAGVTVRVDNIGSTSITMRFSAA
jgi:hypothetical protein